MVETQINNIECSLGEPVKWPQVCVYKACSCLEQAVNWLEYEVLIHALTAQLASWCGPVRLPHKAFMTKQPL